MSSTKKLSGAQGRKRRKLLEENSKLQAKKLATLPASSDSPATVSGDININNAQVELFESNSVNEPSTSNYLSNFRQDFFFAPEPEAHILFRLEDPDTWPELNEKNIQLIVEKGPIQVVDFDFPKTEGRKFCPKAYTRVLPNGQKIPRSWLVYSISKNAVYCFCCKLFAKQKNQAVSSIGFSDWNHMTRMMKSHENSSHHMESFQAWKTLEKALEKNQIVDNHLQPLLRKEVNHWKRVLRRLLIFVQYFGTQPLALSDISSNASESASGNFLQLVEAVAKFDLVLAEHLRRIEDRDTQYSHLSKNIQNELIHLVSSAALDKILKMTKEAKYFSIIVDSTPDKSRTEQVTLVIRFVHKSNNTFECREHFLGFLDCKDKTGLGLTDLVLKKLDSLNLSIANCRGQSYDNRSNIKGKHSGMQNKIREMEPRAFFVPYSGHSLKLVLRDSVHSCPDAVNLFDIVQSLYAFFAGSTCRWNIYKKHVPELTLEPIYETHWESKIDSLQPLIEHLGDINEALIEAAECGDSVVKNTAESLGEKLLEFKFICTLLIWCRILQIIHVVSKYLQSDRVYIFLATKMLGHAKVTLTNLKADENFENFLNQAENIAKDLDIPCRFPEKSHLRSRKKKVVSDENCHHDRPILKPKLEFKENFYFRILDQAINSVDERLKLLCDHNDFFSFLYDVSESAKLDNLKQCCSKLEQKLTNKKNSDINAEELYQELQTLSPLITSPMSSLEVLDFIFSNYLDTLYPNVVIALKILNTLPVTVAARERNFSKNKTIKNYLRATMTQERLLGSAILSIERELVESLESDDLIYDFAKLKARGEKFVQIF